MPRVSPPKFVFFIIWLLVLSSSCVKNLENALNITPPPSDTTSHGTPAVTAIGTPIGNPVSKSIDASGGSILSDDGRLELRFPSGSLSGSTTITIQPVTNETPNGLGVSYQLLPEGSHFNNPVTMIFHYADSDANGTNPYFFYIAYQDANQEWRADVKKRIVDTVAKTVTTTVTHFSIWSMGAEIVMTATPDEVYENQTSTVTVHKSIPVPDNSTPAPGEDYLPPLPDVEELPEGSVDAWKVDGITGGNETDGFILGSGNLATFTAPANIETKRTVQVSAEVNYSVTYFNNNNSVQSLKKFILFTDITLLPSEFDFTVTTDYKELLPVKGNLWYEDKATFDLSIKKYNNPDGSKTIIVLGSGYKNQAPTCSPCTVNTGQGSWTCVPGTFGKTDIYDVSFFQDIIDDSLTITLISTNPETWGTKAVALNGDVANTKPLPIPLGSPNRAKVALKDETQVYHDPADPDNITVTFTPK